MTSPQERPLDKIFALWPYALLAALLACGVVGLRFTALLREQAPPSAETYAHASVGPDGAPPVLWSVPDFQGNDQSGAVISRAGLAQHVWIADFIFTSCTSSCPVLTARMKLLWRKLAGEGLRFVSFSVDPEHDTRDALGAYAARWAKDETRWRLVHLDPAPLADFTHGMRVMVHGTGTDLDPIIHTSLFFLIDGAGRVRGVYDTGEDAALERLARDARWLMSHEQHLPERAPVASLATDALDSLGCRGCHDSSAIAPPLEGLWGRKVTLADHTTALADEAYVRASILTPAAQLVAGYDNLMPSYSKELTPEELDAVVGAVRGRGASPSPASDALDSPSSAIDPVCGMSVHVDPSALHASHAGQTYYFCSPGCRERFVKSPDKFLKGR